MMNLDTLNEKYAPVDWLEPTLHRLSMIHEYSMITVIRICGHLLHIGLYFSQCTKWTLKNFGCHIVRESQENSNSEGILKLLKISKGYISLSFLICSFFFFFLFIKTRCLWNVPVKNGFDSNIFLAISKINHSNHHYRYLVQSLMNNTSWSSIKGWH